MMSDDDQASRDSNVAVAIDDDAGAERGAVYVLFLNSNGTVKGEQKISDLAGGLSTGLDDSDRFGSAVAAMGDVDGDGVSDVTIGAHLDDDGGLDRGADRATR